MSEFAAADPEKPPSSQLGARRGVGVSCWDPGQASEFPAGNRDRCLSSPPRTRTVPELPACNPDGCPNSPPLPTIFLRGETGQPSEFPDGGQDCDRAPCRITGKRPSSRLGALAGV